MRIEAGGVSRGFGRQTRAYAEYRVFSSLARFGHIVDSVTVELNRAERQFVVCVVMVSTTDGRRVRIESRGRHPYDAINRAADRVSDVVRRHDRGAVVPR